MKPQHRSCHGFALVITLGLLALLVLAVYALSALVRVNSQSAVSGLVQFQARQNALFGLGLALDDVQRKAGNDSAVTGIAGVTGIAPNAANSTRHWAGVWRNDGSFVGWMVSGAQSTSAALRTGVTSIELLGTSAVGAAASNSEHVIAGKLPIPDAAGAAVGNYAYVVLDEGVKTSAYSPSPIAAAPVIFSTSATNAQGKLRDALTTYAASLSRVSSYEQLLMLPSPAAALTASVAQDNLHHTTLTSRLVVGNQLQAGYTNVNTNSAIVWRNLLQTYNTSPSASAQITSATTLSTRGTNLQNGIASFSTAGKSVNGPFTSVAGVSAFLGSVFTSGSPTAAQIFTVLAPQLSVRSDTFRIRAYGEVLNSSDGTTVEATAYCEAIVQRTVDLAPNGLGRRFAVTYFRWLGPGDI
jgi:hypothetical protein